MTSADLAATQPVKVPVPFTPTAWQVSVRDSGGRLKSAADVKVTVPTAVAGQAFLGLAFNSAVAGDAGVEVRDLVITAVASSSRNGYFSAPNRPVRILQVDGTVKVAVAGGTLTFDAVKTTAAGVETVLASAVNIATLAAHDPTSIAFDDAALPQSLAATDKLDFQVNGGGGLTAIDVSVAAHYVVLVEAGDVVFVDVYGAA